MTKAIIDIYPVTEGWMARVQLGETVNFRTSSFRWLAKRRAISTLTDMVTAERWVKENESASLHYEVDV